MPWSENYWADQPGHSPDYELVVGSLWEEFVDGHVYQSFKNGQKEAEQELTDAIDKQIVDDLLALSGIYHTPSNTPSRKLDYMWNPEAVTTRDHFIEPTFIVAPVRITSEVEITPNEMKSNLWQQIANPIFHKIRSSLPVQMAPLSWGLKVRRPSLPDTSTLRISPSSYRRCLVAPNRPPNITWPLVPEWYSVNDYPEPLTYGSILTNEPVSVSL